MDNKENITESRWLLPASILIAALLISGAVLYSKNNPKTEVGNNSETKLAQLSIGTDDPVLGKGDAPLTVVEFGDFQCPYCAKFAKEVETNFKKDFVDTGKVKFVFKALAFLDKQTGTESHKSVEASYCAKEQGKFWEFQEAIFGEKYDQLQKYMNKQLAELENNGTLNNAFFEGLAKQNGLNVDAFKGCMSSEKYANVASQNQSQAEALMPQGISTPTVFVNGKAIDLRANQQTGVFDYADFARQLNIILNTK